MTLPDESGLRIVGENSIKHLPFFTPFKRHRVPSQDDGLPPFDGESSVYLPRMNDKACRQWNALTNIVDLTTPRFKTQPIRLPDASHRVVTSVEIRKKLQEKQECKEAALQLKELKKVQTVEKGGKNSEENSKV